MIDTDGTSLLVGKKILSISLDKQSDRLTINTDAGLFVFRTDGDCCSRSWFEGLIVPAKIEGAIVTSVEEIPMDEASVKPWEWIKIYATELRTTAGIVTIEYRNESNGYYGGWMYLEQSPGMTA